MKTRSFSSLISCHQICDRSNMTGATSRGAETIHPSGTQEFTTGFVTEVTWRVPLVEEQKLFTLPIHMSSPLFLCGSRCTLFSFLCSVSSIIISSFPFYLQMYCLSFDLRILITLVICILFLLNIYLDGKTVY